MTINLSAEGWKGMPLQTRRHPESDRRRDERRAEVPTKSLDEMTLREVENELGSLCDREMEIVRVFAESQRKLRERFWELMKAQISKTVGA